MKSASTIANLSIVGIREGEQIAVVKSLLVNRTAKKVEYLSVGQDAAGTFAALISFRDIVGIGNDYIVIKSADDIKKAFGDKSLAAVEEECLIPIGIRVLSSAGDILGSVADYVVDEKTGRIIKLLLDNDQEIDGAKILTLSAKFVMADAGGAADAPEDAGDGEVDSGLDDGSVAYLLGKTVNADIISEDGEFSITKGTVLTRELIARAEKHGALLQLTMEV